MVCHKYLQIFCVILVTGLVCGQSTDAPTAPPATDASTAPPATDAPTAPPATDAPTAPPATETDDPTAPPTTETDASTAPPATDAPTAPPATDAPTAPPATDAPTAPPATDAPTAPPSTETDDPTAPPATDAPTAPPATASGPNSTPPELSTEGIILTCTATQMIVRIPKELLTGDMNGEDVRFENEDSSDCIGEDKNNGTGYEFIELATNLTACGTEMEESNDTETYTNRVINRYVGEAISRKYVVDIPLSCSYDRNQRVGSVEYRLTDYTIDKNLEAESTYTFSFDIYTDDTYTEVEEAYPISIGLNKELYFAASVLSLVGSLDLSIRSCRATPDSIYNSETKFEFIQDGCSNDDSNTNITILTDHYRIGVEMNTFRFVDNEDDWVYIHCDLLVCDAADTNSVCKEECNSSSPSIMGRKRRDVSSELNTKRFTRGPLRVVRSAQRQGSVLRMDASENGASTQQEVTNAFNPWIVAMAAMATGFMAMAAMMAVVLRKFSKISAAPGRYKEDSARLLDENEEI